VTRNYASPASFKNALEQRLRNSAKAGGAPRSRASPTRHRSPDRTTAGTHSRATTELREPRDERRREVPRENHGLREVALDLAHSRCDFGADGRSVGAAELAGSCATVLDTTTRSRGTPAARPQRRVVRHRPAGHRPRVENSWDRARLATGVWCRGPRVHATPTSVVAHGFAETRPGRRLLLTTTSPSGQFLR